jgi:predicted anti-sigma-YlaC factor YlaD
MGAMIRRLMDRRCAEVRAQLSEHLEGSLAPEGERRVLRHLARCARCRSVLASLARTITHLRALGRLEPAAGPSLADAVLARIRRDTG